MFKEKIEEIIDVGNVRRFMILEELFLQMFKLQAEKEGKDIIILDEVMKQPKRLNFNFLDGILPKGINEYEGKTGIIIKFNKNPSGILRIYKEVNAYIQDSDFDNIIICWISNEVECFKKRLGELENSNIHLWGYDEIEKFLNLNKEVAEKAINNLFEFSLNKKIEDSIKKDKENWANQNKVYIRELQEKFKKDDLVLFLGAGVSADAGLPKWEKLLSDMFIELVENKLKENKYTLSKAKKKTVNEKMMTLNDSSPLLQARYVKTGLGDEFINVLREALYKKCKYEYRLIDEIAKLCIPLRDRNGIHAVVTYNFDDILEKNLKRYEVLMKSINKECEVPEKYELGVYHVHGYLPNDKNIKLSKQEKESLVFSEEEYHKLYVEPYRWANLIQLNFLREKTCVFIGLSMTDPNLRRLLDIAYEKIVGKDKIVHYALMKKVNFESNDDLSISEFENVATGIQEKFFENIGIKIIWFDEFEEIPDIIGKIKSY